MDPLIEIRPAASGAGTRVNLEGEPRVGFWSSLRQIWRPKPAAGAKFYGPGTTLKVDRGRVASPLVYVLIGKAGDAPDASLIETGLPVAKPGTPPGAPLPYWPSYRAATPGQRARYWDWLLGGRQDPAVELGYVFIYFYGLERRVLLDRADHAVVAAEVLRLLRIYHRSRSFARYGTSLLWTTIWLGLGSGGVSQELLVHAVQHTPAWSEETLALCLACFARLGMRLPSGVAYLVAGNDVRSPRSVVTKRHPGLHREAFDRRFAERFPQGFELRAGRRDRRLEYFPASATLGRVHDAGGPLAEERFPNVLGLSSQFQPLVDLWSEAIDALKAYDRAHRKSGGEELTAEMYEALPEGLRQGDHPEFDAWYALMSRHVTDDGWTVVPVRELARLKGVAERPRLTKPQSAQLAATVAHMGLALEPDPRITGKAYGWEDEVSVFPATEELGDDVASYHAASVLLELGVAVAAADGRVDEVELGRLTSHLEAQFDLSSQDSARLEHLRYLLAKRPPQGFAAARALQKKLGVKQRRLVGEFLVGVAAADEDVAPAEAKALGKAYRALGLDPADLTRLLRSAAPGSDAAVPPAGEVAPQAESFKLDLARVSAIMSETAKVTEFLRDVLREDAEQEDDGPSDDAEAAAGADPDPTERKPPAAAAVVGQGPADTRWSGLPLRFVPFAAAAAARASWPRGELDRLARSHGQMLGAAVEAVNEWAYENLSDALLIESDEQFLVQRQLLP